MTRKSYKLYGLLPVVLLAGSLAAQPALHIKGLKPREIHQLRALDATKKTLTPGRSHWIVQFSDNPNADQITDVQNLGAKVLSYIPDFAFSVSANSDTSWDSLNAQWIGQLQPDEKISPDLAGALTADSPVSVLVEFYSDVNPDDVRLIATSEGLLIRENADLAPNHLLLEGAGDKVLELAQWDEVSYIFPASDDLAQGVPVRPCVGALTSQGQVTQAIPLIGDGWDGPGLGGANLNYMFVHLTEKLPSDAAQSEIVRAFSEWARYAKVTFSPGDSAAGNKTIAVLFASGAHGDAYPFDGPGGVLAHTFYPFPTNPEPIAGNMHFDNDEGWKIGADVDLFSVALHETGHALGLGHSDKPGDVMYPYYRRVTSLTADDIAAVLQLYAGQDGTSNPTPAPAPPNPAPAPASPLVLSVQPVASPTTASTVSISGMTSGGTGTVQVTWTSNRGYSGVAQGASNWTIAGIPLSTGDNSITITARDSLSQNPVTRTLTIARQQANAPSGPDTTPPAITIVSPSTATVSTSASSLVVSGTARDNVGVAAVTWTSSTGASGMAIGTANWATPPISLYIGSTTITIRASDAAGNTSWRSLTVTRR